MAKFFLHKEEKYNKIFFMFRALGNFLILLTLVGMLAPSAIGLAIFYPFCPKICYKISDYIVNVCARRVFRIMRIYKKFRLSFSKKNFESLPEQFIVLSNHQSLLDIPIYMNFFDGRDVRFVAKDALGKNWIPLVAPMLKSHGHCFIPRRGGASIVMQRIDAFAGRCLSNKWNPVIFPEGTRSKTGELGKFFSAGFRRIADTSKLPVAVCVVDDGWKINDILHVMENMHKINYRAKLLKVFPPALTKEDQVTVLEQARALMQEQLDKWRSGQED